MKEKNLYEDVLSSSAHKVDRSNLAAQAIGGLLAARLLPSSDSGLDNSIGVLGALSKANLLGGVLGHIATKNSNLTQQGKKDLKEASNLSIIPGVSLYRDSIRGAYVDDKLSKGKNKHRSGLAELLGPTTSGLLMTGLGAGIGSLVGAGNDKESSKASARLGAVIGGGSAALIYLLAGIIGRTIAGKRTNKEHAEYLTRSVLPQYIIPGVAAYHRGRRLAMADAVK